MLQTLVITLREGLEAALVVGVILAYLRRTEQLNLTRFVWLGVALAVGASALGAILIQLLYQGKGHEPREQQIISGVIMIVAAVMVTTMIVWMWRSSRRLRSELEGQVQNAVAQGPGAGLSLLLLVFAMVFREGIETVLFLAGTFLAGGADGATGIGGALIGLGLACLFGYLLFRGSVVIEFRRFFQLTGLLLMLFVAELVAGAVHELQEALILPPAGYGPVWDVLVWLASPDSQFYTLIAIVAVPLALMLAALSSPTDGQDRRARRRLAFVMTGLVVFILTAGTQVYAQAPSLEPETVRLESQAELRIPVAAIGTGQLRRYTVAVDGTVVRFLLVGVHPDHAHSRTSDTHTSDVRGGFDSCQVCGTHGFVQKGDAVSCKRCGVETPFEELGELGGCRPFPLAFKITNGTVVVQLADLAPSLGRFDGR